MSSRGAEARWRALIEEYEASGETVGSFCARRGLARPTFYQWRRRLLPGADWQARAASRLGFVPVRVVGSRAAATADAGGVEVVLAGGRRLRLERGFDPAVLSSAMAVLEGAAC